MCNRMRYGKICWPIENKDDFTKFNKREDAEEWGKAYYGAWGEKYKHVMKEAKKKLRKNNTCCFTLEGYCGNLHGKINKFLRDGEDDSKYTSRELADILSIVLCSAPRIPCDLVVYRLVDDKFIKKFIEENKKEAPILEKGFMSTSLIKRIVEENEGYTENKNLLKIFVPKDTIGVYANVVQSRDEQEMLLLCGMKLALSSYPYIDEKTGKKVFECQLIK